MLSYSGNGAHYLESLAASKDAQGRPQGPQSDERTGEPRSQPNNFINNPAQPAGRPFQGHSTSFESNINTFYSMNSPVILPTCSSWFDINGIHQIEKDALPEFFAGKQLKTPQAYKNYRNHIIKLYREDPKNYLTATMCRRNIVRSAHQAGDACSILRIHAFLEHWGLVNFNFNVKNHNFNSITASLEQNANNFEGTPDSRSQDGPAAQREEAHRPQLRERPLLPHYDVHQQEDPVTAAHPDRSATIAVCPAARFGTSDRSRKMLRRTVKGKSSTHRRWSYSRRRVSRQARSPSATTRRVSGERR